MLPGGVPVEVVQMVLGHWSPAVALQVYAHIMKRSQRNSWRASTLQLAERRGTRGVLNSTESNESGSLSEQLDKRGFRSTLSLKLGNRYNHRAVS
jgi:hypothetical protein